MKIRNASQASQEYGGHKGLNGATTKTTTRPKTSSTWATYRQKRLDLCARELLTWWRFSRLTPRADTTFPTIFRCRPLEPSLQASLSSATHPPPRGVFKINVLIKVSKAHVCDESLHQGSRGHSLCDWRGLLEVDPREGRYIRKEGRLFAPRCDSPARARAIATLINSLLQSPSSDMLHLGVTPSSLRARFL